MNDADVGAHRPRNHLPVQRNMSDFSVMPRHRLGDHGLAPCRIGLHIDAVDQFIEHGVYRPTVVEVPVAAGTRPINVRSKVVLPTPFLPSR